MPEQLLGKQNRVEVKSRLGGQPAWYESQPRPSPAVWLQARFLCIREHAARAWPFISNLGYQDDCWRGCCMALTLVSCPLSPSLHVPIGIHPLLWFSIPSFFFQGISGTLQITNATGLGQGHLTKGLLTPKRRESLINWFLWNQLPAKILVPGKVIPSTVKGKGDFTMNRFCSSDSLKLTPPGPQPKSYGQFKLILNVKGTLSMPEPKTHSYPTR